MAIALWCAKKPGEWTWDKVVGLFERFGKVHADALEIRDNHLQHLQKGIDEIGIKQDITNRKLAEQTGYLKAIAEHLNK